MKKINIILITLIIIISILIFIKIKNQEIIEKKELESGISEENIRYEVKREILYGEKSKYSEFTSDGKRVNTSEEIKKIKNIEEGVEVTKFDIISQNNYTNLNIYIKNTSTEIKGGYDVELVLSNDKNKELFRLPTYFNSIEPGNESLITTSITGDIADIYKCEICKMEDNN